MEVKVIERKDNYIKLEVSGESHTVFNPLMRELAKRDDVEIVTYHIPHPEIDKVIFTLKTKEGTKAEEILFETIDKIIDELKNTEIVE